MLSQSVPRPGPGGMMSGCVPPPLPRPRWKSSGRQPCRPSGRMGSQRAPGGRPGGGPPRPGLMPGCRMPPAGRDIQWRCQRQHDGSWSAQRLAPELTGIALRQTGALMCHAAGYAVHSCICLAGVSVCTRQRICQPAVSSNATHAAAAHAVHMSSGHSAAVQPHPPQACTRLHSSASQKNKRI